MPDSIKAENQSKFQADCKPGAAHASKLALNEIRGGLDRGTRRLNKKRFGGRRLGGRTLDFVGRGCLGSTHITVDGDRLPQNGRFRMADDLAAHVDSVLGLNSSGKAPAAYPLD